MDIRPPRQLPKPMRSSNGRPNGVPMRPPAPQGPQIAPRATQPTLTPTVSSLQLPSKSKKRWLKWVGIITSVFVIVLTISGFLAYTWYIDALKPLSDSQERIKVLIPAGAANSDITRILEEKKLVKSGLALDVYIRLHAISDMKAGNYLFTPSQSPAEILEWLRQGKVDTFKLTILPGKTIFDLKETFKKYGYPADEIEAAFAKHYDNPLFLGKPESASLEGYIYPETYYVTSDEPLEAVLSQGFNFFYERIQKAGIMAKLQARGINLYQAITLASMVEKEVPKEDQRQVAQIFYTRLALGMSLGSDVTYKYGALLLGVQPTPQLDSPYNTRVKVGLPPGPVSNFNFFALEAVAEPAEGDFVYFVSGDDGKTLFSHTLQEQEANISQFCQKLCSQN